MNVTQFAGRLSHLVHELEFGPLPGPQGEERYAAMEEEFATLTANRKLIGELVNGFIARESESSNENAADVAGSS